MNKISLKAGAGKAVLHFPPEYFPVEGFAGIHDEVSARALILKKEEDLVIVSLELPSLKPYSLIDEMKEYVSGLTKILPEHIWICVTHNVSAPHVPPHNCPPDKESLAKQKLHVAVVKDAIREAVTQAMDRMQEAAAGAGRGRACVNVNRDILTNSGWWLGIEGTGPSDKTVSVIRIDSAEGKPLAVLFNYAVKTAVIDDARMSDGNRYVTADLTGEACRAAEEKLGAVVIYFMGAAADQVPMKKAQYYTTDSQGNMVSVNHYEKGFQWVKELGEILGDAVVEAAGSVDKKNPYPRMEITRKVLNFPGQEGYPRELPYAPVKEYTYIPAPQRDVEVEILRIDDGVILGVKPEITSIIGMDLRERSPFKETMLASMVNGGMNYMSDKEAYDRFAFEGTHSVLARGSAEAFVEKITDILKQMI